MAVKQTLQLVDAYGLPFAKWQPLSCALVYSDLCAMPSMPQSPPTPKFNSLNLPGLNRQ